MTRFSRQRRRGPDKGYAGSPAHSQLACGNRRAVWYHISAWSTLRQASLTPP